MTISDIDKNFKFAELNRKDVIWFDVKDYPQMTFGIKYYSTDGRFCRMPQGIADTVSDGVAVLCRHTAGGRFRFKTDSPFIAIKAIIDDTTAMYHMPFTGSHGFGLYVDGVYKDPMAMVSEGNGKYECKAVMGYKEFNSSSDKYIEIYFPLYNGVKELYIGIIKGGKLEKGKAFDYANPVLFYGSSITQGGCASHAGNDYPGLLSRWLNCDYINLGFSGSCKGETVMAEYIANVSASVFVIDYDHNAPSTEYLRQTHYPFYKTIRNKNPKTPIIFISRPNDSADYKERREVIIETLKRAKDESDHLAHFIDGHKFFGKKDRDACTVDMCHPNDLGFYRMAKGIYPSLKKVIDV